MLNETNETGLKTFRRWVTSLSYGGASRTHQDSDGGSPPAPDDPAGDKRETFSTRIRPGVRSALKRRLLGVQAQGQKVRMETFILRCVQDADFRAEVMNGIEE